MIKEVLKIVWLIIRIFGYEAKAVFNLIFQSKSTTLFISKQWFNWPHPQTASGVTHYGETALWGLKIVSKYGSTFVTEFIEFNSAKVADELFGKRIIDTY